MLSSQLDCVSTGSSLEFTPTLYSAMLVKYKAEDVLFCCVQMKAELKDNALGGSLLYALKV